MPNKNYIKGRALEYKIKQELEENGWFVVRSAGSHGPIDLACFSEDAIALIQCKTKAPTKPEVETLAKFVQEHLYLYRVHKVAVLIMTPEQVYTFMPANHKSKKGGYIQ